MDITTGRFADTLNRATAGTFTSVNSPDVYFSYVTLSQPSSGGNDIPGIINIESVLFDINNSNLIYPKFSI
jgi:hypothetical protein